MIFKKAKKIIIIINKPFGEGIPSIKNVNKAFVLTWIWRIGKDKGGLWCSTVIQSTI